MKPQFELILVAFIFVYIISLIEKPSTAQSPLSPVSEVQIISYDFEPNKSCSIFSCKYPINLYLKSESGYFSLPIHYNDTLFPDVVYYQSLLKDKKLLLKTYKFENFICAYSLTTVDGLTVFDFSHIYELFKTHTYSKYLDSLILSFGTLPFPQSIDNACYKYGVHLNQAQAY